MNKKDKYVLDTSALFAFFDKEDGGERVKELLTDAQKDDKEIIISFATYMEVYYIYFQEQGEQDAINFISLIDALPIKIIDSSKRLALKAGDLKAKYKISFADSLIIATAVMESAILVHKDPEMEAIENELEVLKLPYKK